ncbi:MAG TPA: Ig-like domain-containing protein, partial [Planctomycetota bacterium]|nr:Ig-like domain-containing protein [Planctomycetota bacterium]
MVVPATLVSISITPGIPQPLPVGRTEQFRATGTFSDHSTRDLTEHIEWSSSAATIVEVSTTDGSRGLATGLRVGTARIRARDPSSGLVAQEIELRVTAAVLESIEVTASSSASLPVGRTRRLTATGRFSDASARVLTGVVDWQSSNDSIATVSSGPGERGIVTGEAVGTAQITAVDAATGIASAPFPIQVSAAVLATIDVTPASLPPLAKGRKVTFKAAGTFSDGTTDDDISDSVEWSSLEPSVASISNDAGTIGVATALAKGTTMITARDPASGVTSPAVTLQVTDAVLESISISSSTSGPLAKGRGRQFEATGLFSDGSTLSMTSAVTWNSSDPNVADISNAAGSEGLASARMIGVTKISAVDPITHVGSAEIELTVTEAVLDAIDI